MSIKLAMELIFSAKEDGGGTFDRYGKKIESSYSSDGEKVYVVGGRYEGLEIRVKSNIIEATEAVAKWVDGCNNTLHFGSWVEDDIIYIDAVDLIYDRELAVDFAINRGQKAIYELVEGETIYV